MKWARMIPNPREDQRISFILEGGHKNIGDALRIFQETKKKYPSSPLGEFATASKADYGAVQAADLLAYGSHRHLEEYLKKSTTVDACRSYNAIISSALFEDLLLTDNDLLLMGNALIAGDPIEYVSDLFFRRKNVSDEPVIRLERPDVT